MLVAAAEDAPDPDEPSDGAETSVSCCRFLRKASETTFDLVSSSRTRFCLGVASEHVHHEPDLPSPRPLTSGLGRKSCRSSHAWWGGPRFFGQMP